MRRTKETIDFNNNKAFREHPPPKQSQKQQPHIHSDHWIKRNRDSFRNSCNVFLKSRKHIPIVFFQVSEYYKVLRYYVLIFDNKFSWHKKASIQAWHASVYLGGTPHKRLRHAKNIKVQSNGPKHSICSGHLGWLVITPRNLLCSAFDWTYDSTWGKDSE